MEATLKTINAGGEQTGSIALNPAWLEAEKGNQAVKDAVVAFLAANRAGTAKTKTRGQVRGGGAKPWKQKGTGRARAGSIRSPLWRKGAVIFGPIPRSYDKKLNRSVRRLALKRSFTDRLADGDILVVEEIAMAAPKTKAMLAFLDKIGAGQEVLLVVEELNEAVLKSAANLPGVEVMKASSVNPYWLLLFKKIVFTKAALDAFGKRLVAAREVES